VQSATSSSTRQTSNRPARTETRRASASPSRPSTSSSASCASPPGARASAPQARATSCSTSSPARATSRSTANVTRSSLTGAFVAPGERWSVDNPGSEELLVVAVSAAADLAVDDARRKKTIRFDDQPEHTASVERTFRYLINEDAGCLDVTQFIGIVQPSKAPFHSHPYEELGYIVKGEGVAHVGGVSVPLRPGSCFHLPPEKVHCIENVGPEPMHILGVFHPSDSPANRVYQDNN